MRKREKKKQRVRYGWWLWVLSSCFQIKHQLWNGRTKYGNLRRKKKNLLCKHNGNFRVIECWGVENSLQKPVLKLQYCTWDTIWMPVFLLKNHSWALVAKYYELAGEELIWVARRYPSCSGSASALNYCHTLKWSLHIIQIFGILQSRFKSTKKNILHPTSSRSNYKHVQSHKNKQTDLHMLAWQGDMWLARQ